MAIECRSRLHRDASVKILRIGCKVDTLNENQMFAICKDLFPLNRSLSGQGGRDTLLYIKKLVPELTVHEEKCGTQIFDWVTPEEWNVTDAYVADSKGNRLSTSGRIPSI